jgi:glycosyltransferase involved in cell wall biosynthesis
MRVGVNGCSFNHLPSGVMKRFAGLYGEIFADPTHEYVVFEPRDASLSNFFVPRQGVDFARTVLPSTRAVERLLLGSFYWNGALRDRRIDVFDTSYLPLVKNKRGTTFLTLHDIRFVKYPELYSLQRRLLARSVTRSALLHADVVISVSETMASEILEFEPRANVRVLPNAIEWGETEAGEKKSSPGRYVLAVGHLERRKNYPRLIEAFERVAKRGYDGELVIVGSPTDDAERTRACADRSAFKTRIHIRSGVAPPDLRQLYQGADLFVFPSLYEGFGIPILEAMSFGCPFVLSDLPVFREITIGKALYFRPSDPSDIAEKIWMMLTNVSLRLACRRLAEERRPVYSWKSVAKAYLSLLREFVP